MNYNYDVLNNTLTVSEKFLKAAGKYNSAEYNVVKALRADNPAMQIVVEKKQQKSANKNLTFKQMEGFINDSMFKTISVVWYWFYFYKKFLYYIYTR